MTRHVDALASPTLKNLREQWWNAAFAEFLHDTLRPRPGNRILDAGCGEGTAETGLGRLHISQLQLFAIDRQLARVQHTSREARAHNLRLGLAAADVQQLPFATGAFDAAFCVAVLQHVKDVPGAVGELARVTRSGGRVVAVEPDNSARYWFSSSPLGREAFDAASRFFAAAAEARADTTDPAVGPRLSSLFAACGIEPTDVQLFPVSVTHLGVVPPPLWQARRQSVQHALERADGERVRALADEYLRILHAYERDAASAGARFVEIQHTMLFATVGQRTDAPPREQPALAADREIPTRRT